MHSAIWHKSPENIKRQERIYLEVNVQDIDDPSTTIELIGIRKSEWILPENKDNFFKNSRTQKIKILYEEIDRQKMNLKA